MKSKLQALDSAWNMLFRGLKTTVKVIFVAWRVTSEPIAELLQEQQLRNRTAAPELGLPETRSINNPKTSGPAVDERTEAWADKKLAEHSFVGITCGLLAGVVSAAFSWRGLDNLTWVTKGSWYGSLVIDLASICLATQQSLALNRLCCYRDRSDRILRMLGGGRARARRSQLFIWQAPIMLLNIGVILFVVGLVSLIFSDLEVPWSTYDVRVVVLAVLAGAFAGSTYLFSSFVLSKDTLLHDNK